MVDLKNFRNKRICVAVSGGRDSVALLHFLKTQAESCGFLLSAVHCEHGIRGKDSLEDMRFVEKLCGEWKIPLVIFQADCPSLAQKKKMSLETAARAFRYECFSSLINEGKADVIATAHHSDDEAETVLFRIARGTLSGAKGMSEACGWLLRPILQWSRADVDEYVYKNGLSYREDETNGNSEFTRNKLRNIVLPLLNETVDGASGNLARFGQKLSDDDALLYEYAAGLLSETEEGYFVAESEKKPLFTRACLLALRGLGLEKDYTSAHLDGAYALQQSERGAKLDFPKGLEAVKAENGLLFRKRRAPIDCEKPTAAAFSLNGFDGGRYVVSISKTLTDEKKDFSILRIDGGKIPENAVFRFREDGDEMKTFGGGTKSLKKFFNEKKIPVEEREFIPIIALGKEIYAVCGYEISEKVKITPETSDVLYIALTRKEK